MGRAGGRAGAAGYGGVWGCGRGSEPAGDAARQARGGILRQQGPGADRGDGGGALVVEVVVGVGFSLIIFLVFFPSNIVKGFSSGSFLFLGSGLSFRWCRKMVRSLFHLGSQCCYCALLALLGRVC